MAAQDGGSHVHHPGALVTTFSLPRDLPERSRDHILVSRGLFALPCGLFDLSRDRLELPRAFFDLSRDLFYLWDDRLQLTLDLFDLSRDLFDPPRDFFELLCDPPSCHVTSLSHHVPVAFREPVTCPLQKRGH